MYGTQKKAPYGAFKLFITYSQQLLLIIIHRGFDFTILTLQNIIVH